MLLLSSIVHTYTTVLMSRVTKIYDAISSREHFLRL